MKDCKMFNKNPNGKLNIKCAYNTRLFVLARNNYKRIPKEAKFLIADRMRHRIAFNKFISPK